MSEKGGKDSWQGQWALSLSIFSLFANLSGVNCFPTCALLHIRKTISITMIFARTQKEILSDEKLHNLLQTLYRCYLDKGMILNKVIDEDAFDWERASELQLISFDEDYSNWIIEPNYLFAFTVLDGKILDLQSKVPNDAAELAEYFEIATKLSEGKGRTGITLLADRIMELLLALTHETTGETFYGWITKLDEQELVIKFEFLQAYCKIADILPLDATLIVHACHHFFTWNDLAIFPNVNPLIDRLVARDINEAERLTINLPAEFRIVRTMLLSWLIKHASDAAWSLIQRQFDNSENQSYILGAIHHFEFNKEARAWEALDLITTYNSTMDESRRHVPYALTRILIQTNFEDMKFVNQCFQILKEMAGAADLETVKHILSSSSVSAEKYPSQTTELMIELLKNINVTYEHLASQKNLISFDNVLAEISNVKLIFNFFKEFALLHPFKFNRDIFLGTVHHLSDITEGVAELCKEVISLVVHDEGATRYLGIEILNSFRFESFQTEFAQNIKELDPILQYKLWMSILSMESSPKNSLVWLLPLLDSKNEIVSEALLCKLEELTESYHEEIITIVERYSEENAQIIQKAVMRLKAHYAGFCKMLDRKNNIVEFHPSICQSQYYDRFRELHRHTMNKQINNILNNREGIMSFAKKVVLVKGGGWKHRDRDEITKLGRFQSSYSWPRLHLLNPERFDLERRISLASNWKSDKTDFEEWIID
ncbi:hypothetical protein ACFP1I_23265 [Dyadobacter subterraneus]|uniref:Uncharacterized protein n=1 Tax=Dyadobacter subterraneus TaxID=2773304 RepID=A0ABR9WAC6_9BACT|nr:hypothetical protein [Dyadobacter subterraneus]MBE9461911.1 hypothetical protein [Dyadobacter subterraneus]